MTKTYTLTKKQVAEFLEITPAKVDKLVKAEKLSRIRKTPGNDRSTWLYSQEEVDQVVGAPTETPCTPSDTCCQEVTNISVTVEPVKKKWFQFWK